jgi:ring-1,2-phenylacetyl-CoA epoxidase subunit PaaA
MKWKIKRFSNDELRQKFVDITAEQTAFLGLTLPDEHLELDPETGHYKTGEIDWTEFKAVVSGNGPCNRQRLDARVKAWEEGAWVREAAEAHAHKQKARQKEAYVS